MHSLVLSWESSTYNQELNVLLSFINDLGSGILKRPWLRHWWSERNVLHRVLYLNIWCLASIVIWGLGG